MNIQKALLPGLWSLLAAGGYGSAKVAYPCLLPLLSKLVEQVRKFCNFFFEPSPSMNVRKCVTVHICMSLLFSVLQVFASDVNFARSFLDRLKSG